MCPFCLPAGASWLGRGLVKGGSAAGRAIHKGASSLRGHITPQETPAEVSPRVSKGLNVAREASGGAVKVSQFIGESSRLLFLPATSPALLPRVSHAGQKIGYFSPPEKDWEM